MAGQKGRYEAELRRRLKAATNEAEMAKVRKWFTEQMVATENVYLRDLSPFEQWFAVHEVYEPFQRWVAAQKKKEAAE